MPGYYDTVAEFTLSTPTRRWVIETKAEVVNGETSIVRVLKTNML